MLINLKRKLDIFNDTPLDVIVYFLKTIGKNIKRDKIDTKRDKILNFIKDFNCFIDLEKEFQSEDYEKISSYISDTEEAWTVENLMKSFQDLLIFEKRLNFKELKTGIRKNLNPYNLDIIMVYQICQNMEIKTSKDDTLEILVEKIQQRKYNRENMLDNIKNNIMKCSDYQLMNIEDFIPIDEENNDYSKDKLELLTKGLNMNYIIKRSILTSEEAVVYSAKFFSTDITKSNFPNQVLKKLSDGDFDFDFKDSFSKNFKLNNNFYKMDKFWKKNVHFLYNSKIMNNLKKYEGIVDTEEEIDELDKRLEEMNYYHGRIPDINTMEDDENIISYGIMKNKKMEILNLKNIHEEFVSTDSFGKYEKNINKLLIICKELEGEIYEKLFDTIIFIKKFGLVVNKEMKNLKNKLIFEKLHELSLLFEVKEKISDLDNLSILNSSRELIEIFDNEDDKTKELPLITYRNSKFIKASDNYYTTIYEDLKALKDLGDKPIEYIKTKKDYYKYSSYFYFFIIQKEELFEL